MKKTKPNTGWSLNQGLAAQYAAQAGLDPDLAAAAGESSWDVLKALRDAADERDPSKRKKRVVQTKRRLSKADLGRHGALVKSIHARLASLEGEGPSINPETGLQEFALYPTKPTPPSGPMTASYWKGKWAGDPNDSSVAASAVKSVEGIDAREGKFGEIEALRNGLARRYLYHGTVMSEPSHPADTNYDERLNEFGLQWDVDPKDFGSLKPAGDAEQKFWMENRDRPSAIMTLQERGLVLDKDGTVAVQPKRHHPNPMAGAFRQIDLGIARRKIEDNPMSGNIPGL